MQSEEYLKQAVEDPITGIFDFDSLFEAIDRLQISILYAGNKEYGDFESQAKSYIKLGDIYFRYLLDRNRAL